MNLVKKLGLSLVMFVAAFCVQAETETVDGITWTYQVSNGKAEIRNGYYAVVSTRPTGSCQSAKR